MTNAIVRSNPAVVQEYILLTTRLGKGTAWDSKLGKDKAKKHSESRGGVGGDYGAIQ